MKRFLVHLLCAFVPSKKKRRMIRRKYLTRHFNYEWLGKHSYFGENFIRLHKDTTIGAFCSIGNNVSIGPSQHPTNWLSTSIFQYIADERIVPEQPLFDYKFPPTFVGNDVWIGNNVVVKDGVSVGDGCVIGSNAVVTHDLPPYAIAVGVPAKVVRYRFSEDIIKQLLELQWWSLPDEEIAKLPFNDVEACIEQLKEIRKRLPLGVSQGETSEK